MMNHLEHGERPARKRRFLLLPHNSPLGWTPYAWLVYLLMFVLEPTLRQRPAWVALLTYAGAAVFLAAYFRAFWARGREHALLVAFMASLGVVFAPINGGASTFFVYACAFVAQRPSART